jgi:hypothetical protein
MLFYFLHYSQLPFRLLSIIMGECLYRRKIRLIENNANCRYLKKFTCEGTAGGGGGG